MNKKSMNRAQVVKSQNYQDYVIKDGKLVGDWEGLYSTFDDPWHQSRSEHLNDTRKIIATNWCQRLRVDYSVNRVIELGCGFGYLTNTLQKKVFVRLE